MSQNAPVPTELVSWAKTQVSDLKGLVHELETITENDADDTKAWVLNLLEESSRAEAIGRRIVHLMTTYALREQLASATVVAKRSGMTLSGAQNRAGSRLSNEVWAEVWPRQDR